MIKLTEGLAVGAIASECQAANRVAETRAHDRARWLHTGAANVVERDKDATVKRFHNDDHSHFEAHLEDFVNAHFLGAD